MTITTDQQMRKALNSKYKKQVNELLHWDINVIDWEIIITKWWWSNNRIVFPDESQLKIFLDGVEWQVHISQWHQQQKDFKMIIKDCWEMIDEIKSCPEYFHDDRDDSIVDMLDAIKNILSKYVD